MMQLDSRQIQILQEMGLPVSLYGKGLSQKSTPRHSASAKDLTNAAPTVFATPTPLAAARDTSSAQSPIAAKQAPSLRANAAIDPLSNIPKTKQVNATGSQTHPLEPLIVSDLGWEALKTKAGTCEACRLSATRHHVTFGCSVEASSGKNKAPAPATVMDSLDWLILDYMPSDLEDQTKNPLLSESGQLLANMLKALRGLHKNWHAQMGNSSPAPEPSMVLVNALKCHAPASTSVQAAEVLQCSAYLRRQIELLKPKAILVLGLHAYKALFINQSRDASSSTAAQIPFAQLRSQVHEIHQTPTFLTYHPSYLLTHPQDKAKAWQDLCLAHEHLQRSSA